MIVTIMTSDFQEVSLLDIEKDVALTIPGSDTVPMLLRNEHFKDVTPYGVQGEPSGQVGWAGGH